MDSQATRRQLQGPKPSSLAVSRSSTKIKKHHPSPVVVYLRSPKVFHVRPQEFMDLVQLLTGNPVSAAPAPSSSSSRPEMEKGAMDETEQLEDFIGRVGPIDLSTDFHALMQFVDFV